MRLQKRLIYSIAFAVILFFLSLFIPFIPCQTAPLVPNPIYKWTTCTLNPDLVNLIGISKKYLGYTSSLVNTYLLLMVFSFVLAMVVLYFVARTKKR